MSKRGLRVQCTACDMLLESDVIADRRSPARARFIAFALTAPTSVVSAYRHLRTGPAVVEEVMRLRSSCGRPLGLGPTVPSTPAPLTPFREHRRPDVAADA
jgi:hypothetical protein